MLLACLFADSWKVKGIQKLNRPNVYQQKTGIAFRHCVQLDSLRDLAPINIHHLQDKATIRSQRSIGDFHQVTARTYLCIPTADGVNQNFLPVNFTLDFYDQT